MRQRSWKSYTLLGVAILGIAIVWRPGEELASVPLTVVEGPGSVTSTAADADGSSYLLAQHTLGTPEPTLSRASGSACPACARAAPMEEAATPAMADSDAVTVPVAGDTPQPVPPSLDPVLAAAEAECAEVAAWLTTQAGPISVTTARPRLERRRTALSLLIAADAERALAQRLPWRLRQAVPVGLRHLLEQPVSAVGAWDVVAASDGSVERRFATGTQTWQASTHGARLATISRPDLAVSGIALDGRLAVADRPVRRLDPGEPVPADAKPLCPISGKAGKSQPAGEAVEIAGQVHWVCEGGHITALDGAYAEGGAPGLAADPVLASAWTTGVKDVLHIIARFQGDTDYPQTVANAESMMQGVTDFYEKSSYGRTSMVWDIVQVTLPQTSDWYKTNDSSGYTLYTDARNAAKAAGKDTVNYDLDAVRFRSIYGGWAGKASVGGKRNWLQNSSVGVVVHEYGHNYGLWHANFWNTSDRTVIGAGSNSEYGDPFSEMGGAGNFHAYERRRLDWLDPDQVTTVTASGRYRLHACDTVNPASGQACALVVRKDAQRDYWLDHRQEYNNDWNRKGVLLRWDPWSITGVGNSGNGPHLLDTSPGSSKGKTDAALVLGRTFSDLETGIHFSTIALDGATSPPSVMVEVNLGQFPGNRAPTATLTASATAVGTNTDATFSVAASDADGDPLSYWWDFGDTTWAGMVTSTSKKWGTAKDYQVRCVVSDRKGGVSTVATVIRVGTVDKFRISGRVAVGSQGLEGVRVHTGNTASSVWTDSNGNYTLLNLAAGDHTVQASKDFHSITALFTNPVTVGPDASDKNFSAVRNAVKPFITIAATDTAAGEPGNHGAFEVRLDPPPSTPITVTYVASGSATAGSDYETLTGTLAVPAGSTAVPIPLLVIDDSVAETSEYVALTVSAAPAYLLGAQVYASFNITDNDGAGAKPMVSITAIADGRVGEPGDHGAFRVACSPAPSTNLTVALTVAGTATAGSDYQALPARAGGGTQVTITAGTTMATLSVVVLDDALVESDETVQLTILSNSAYNLGTSTSASLALEDDDTTPGELRSIQLRLFDGAGGRAGIVVERLSVGGIPDGVERTTGSDGRTAAFPVADRDLDQIFAPVPSGGG